MKNEKADSLLINQKQVRLYPRILQNQRKAKKAGKRTCLFDFRTKLYKMTRLESEKLLDLTVPVQQGNRSETAEEILAAIEREHIVGLSGGGFPAAEKIMAIMRAEVPEKILLVNAVECDPGLLHDEWLLLHRWQDIEQGISALNRIIPFAKIVVASRHIVQPTRMELPISFLQTDYFYPMGEEHFLIKKALGIALEMHEIPAQKGILVHNIQTVLAIGQAAAGIPFDCRYLTAIDLPKGTAKIVRATFGADVKATLKLAFEEQPSEAIYAGDGVMRCHSAKPDEKITAQTNCVIYAVPAEYSKAGACLGCGTCQKKCPLKLPVAGLMKYNQYGQTIPQDILNDCLHCNACSYFCKAGIDLMQYLK